MGHQNNQITIKDILSKHDNMYDVLLSMQLNLFPLSSLDLVDVDNEKQYGSYYAFSIPIPAELVKEAVLTAKQSDSHLSRLVLKYPYIQLIVEYWILNKIYSICQSNPKLIGASEFIKDYKSFNKYLSYHYLPYEEYTKNPDIESDFGYTATFESMASILQQLDGKKYKTISYKKESGYDGYSKEIIYNIADFEFAVDDAFRNTDFTLYDFIYDLFYNGVCKTLRASFKNGIINKYIPLYKLPKNTFTYKELKFNQLYGSETELELFPNIDRNIVRLECTTPKLLSDKSIIVKSADNEYNKKYKEQSYNFQNDYYNPKLGPGYDELWEVCGRSIEQAKANKHGERDLYTKWFFTPIEEPAPPMRKYPERITDDKGNIIKEIYEYTYKETEEILGTRFYFTHNFHVKTPCMYRNRMMKGYEWDRMSPIDDVLYTTNENILISSLYYKYMGLQLITAAFISTYTGGA